MKTETDKNRIKDLASSLRNRNIPTKRWACGDVSVKVYNLCMIITCIELCPSLYQLWWLYDLGHRRYHKVKTAQCIFSGSSFSPKFKLCMVVKCVKNITANYCSWVWHVLTGDHLCFYGFSKDYDRWDLYNFGRMTTFLELYSFIPVLVTMI